MVLKNFKWLHLTYNKLLNLYEPILPNFNLLQMRYMQLYLFHISIWEEPDACFLNELRELKNNLSASFFNIVFSALSVQISWWMWRYAVFQMSEKRIWQKWSKQIRWGNVSKWASAAVGTFVKYLESAHIIWLMQCNNWILQNA